MKLTSKNCASEPKLTVPYPLLSADLSPTAKMLWVVLKGFIQNGNSTPTMNQVCEHLRLSTTMLCIYRKELATKGWLTVEQHHVGGRFRGNTYRLHVPKPAPRSHRVPPLSDRIG